MNILIIEDEVLLAMELESDLQTAGHTVVGLATSMSEAFALIDRHRPEFAFVDIHLKDGPTGIEVGRRLAQDDVPYVFMTGNIKRIPDDFAGALGAIEKPYSVNGFRNALTYLTGLVQGKDLGQSPPPSLVVPENLEANGREQRFASA